MKSETLGRCVHRREFALSCSLAVTELFLGIILQTEHDFSFLISTKLAASQRIIISQHIT